MKLLGWMHRKSKQESNEPVKNIVVGNSATSFSDHTIFEEQEYYAKPNDSFTKAKHPQVCQKARKEIRGNRAEIVLEEEPHVELFHGFLAIGTLGSQMIDTDPPTPTFPMPFEHLMHGEIDISEKELKLINIELEKFLETEVNEVSYESSARSSHASIITLSGKQIEGEVTECYSSLDECPLQKYLLGSSVEMSETEAEGKKQNGSQGELFERNNIVQEYHIGKDGKEKKQSKRRYPLHFLKKMLKNLQSKSKSSTAPSSGDVTDSVSSKRKLPQVLNMFRRKVHPEGLIDESKILKDEIRKSTCTAGYLGAKDEVSKEISHDANPKKKLNAFEVCPSSMRYDALTENRELWIKTDADYLVLEL